ncbi:MAG: hypothetical protein KA314_13210 [Chloroflexi bacterium]|nr:hypothetical protein [Chloroflexota bacterium]MBP8056792.1 hypothetical protein [Chloroflexota bacterium]
MNQTEQFLGQQTEWPAAALQLHALQGLWGGRIITVSGTGQVVARLVGRGMWERRYVWQMDAAATQTLFALFIHHDFAALSLPLRPGIPDETLIQLSLTNSQGTIITHAQWQTDSHPIFDTLSTALLKLESQTETLEPVYAGPYS